MPLRLWPPPARLTLIKVVGVSASGKSTLVDGLRKAGYDARPVSQEHSDVADLWRRFDSAKLLLFLDVSLHAQRARREDVTWTATARSAEQRRLAHAREHADLIINTSSMAPESVLEVALAFVRSRGARGAGEALPPLAGTGAPRD
jgi:RNase adaptor protein for sRNA GlmZ degradation